LVWFHFAKITLYSDIFPAHRENPLTLFSDAWGLMGRIVINLCLGVYFAKPEEEKYAARHYMFLTAGKRSATSG